MLLRRGPSDISLPSEASKKLLSMFMQRKLISGFELHVGRVVRSFQHGSSEPAVPALFYAMLLLGCHFISDPELKFWENMFYERTKREIEANVARAYTNDRMKYNPLYHLQAMVMLGQWFYLKNRLLEGYVYVTRAMQFAIALGLHELDTRTYGHYVAMGQKPSCGVAERWSPRDPIELGEAINLWWSCFEREYGGIVLNGLPPSISLDQVKTVWPVALSDFEDMGESELPNDNHSVSSIFDPEHYHIIADVSQDTANCIVAKGTILTYSAGKLDTERMSGSEVTDEWWARFEECDRGIVSFTESVRKAYFGRDIEEVAMVALAHTAVDCATIQLHGPLADYELGIGAQGDSRGLLADNSLGGYSYMRCIEACRSIALATAYIEGIDTGYMQMFFGISWSCAAGVLAKHIPRLRQSGCTEQAQEMEQQLRLLAKSMKRLLATYPVLEQEPKHFSPGTPPAAASSAGAVLPHPEPILPSIHSRFSFKPQPNTGWSGVGGSEPSTEIIRRLLDIFIQRHVQCCFELELNKVMRSLEPGAAEPIIPALYNAMLLVACHFTQDPELRAWEGAFLERTKWEIEANITRAHGGRTHNYNSLHHLVAMSLFGFYFYLKGRLLEGYVYTGQATRFAVALGMHQLHSRIFRERSASSNTIGQSLVEPWYPASQGELAEAINVWWKCCGLDMGGSALNGLPTSISPEEITTVWPRLLSEYEPGQIIPDDNHSVESLFDPQLSHIVTDSSQDNVQCLLAKACILMISSAKLATERISGAEISDEWWMRFEQVDRCVNRFMETMPPVYLGRNNEELSHLIIAHSGIYCAQVQLHSTLAEYEVAQAAQDSYQDFLGGVSYTRCTEACRATALAAAVVSHLDMSNMLLFIGIAWVSVSEVLIRDIPRLRRGGKFAQAREKEHQLAIIEKCMERGATTYPVFSLQLNQIQLLKGRQPS
ncbi:unnamed protein product [Rhizoctonia solani]|uniref:Xylanolytic transcriptional activator regulatory domain-containing protein n=1 Tax=Rhizoctonia solani TaxID=456999 RepID=A0A8H3A9V2_9AGAM|nr:unnamed protein product [Rhizoctonia solani]